MTLGHGNLYIQLHKAGVPTKLAETAAGIANHEGIPPGLLDILAAVIAAVNARCERLEARIEALQQQLRGHSQEPMTTTDNADDSPLKNPERMKELTDRAWKRMQAREQAEALRQEIEGASEEEASEEPSLNEQLKTITGQVRGLFDGYHQRLQGQQDELQALREEVRQLRLERGGQ